MNQELALYDLAQAIRKRLHVIVVISIVSLISGGGIGYFAPPTYTAQTELLVNSSSGTNPSTSDIETNIRLIETYKQIMKSDRMKSKIASIPDFPFTQSDLGKKIKIKSDEGSQIIVVIAYGQTHEQVATLLNTYVDLFQEEIRTLMNLENVTVLKEVVAGKDTQQIKTKLLIYVILPFILSHAIYLTFILLREIHSPLLDSERKVERAFQLPLLGTIYSNRSQPYVSMTKPDHFSRAAASDFGKLAGNLHYLIKHKKLKTFMITSPSRGDGKTFIGGHLAVALASDDKKTLFIDADFRNSTGRTFFDLPERKGLTSVTSGHFKMEEIIQNTDVPNLSFISTGPLPENPTPYFLSGRMERLILELKAMFDVVIIDTSALNVADAVSLLPILDGCLFVADAERTKEKAAMEGFKSLKKVNGHIIGTVLNKAKTPKQ